MFCKNCGTEIPEGAGFCPSCGTPAGADAPKTAGEPAQPTQQPAQPTPPAANRKSKIAAGLLGIFLGSLGIHNFYLGFNKRGLLQLLLSVCTCGIGALPMQIWGLSRAYSTSSVRTATPPTQTASRFPTDQSRSRTNKGLLKASSF